MTERVYPIAIGAVGAVVFFALAPSFPVSSSAAPSLFAAVISVAAIAVGFLATAKSILLSIDNKPIIVNLKAAGKYGLLLDYLMGATFWSFLLSGASIVCFLADLDKPATWHRWLFAMWVFMIFVASASCYRVIHLFGKILRTKD